MPSMMWATWYWDQGAWKHVTDCWCYFYQFVCIVCTQEDRLVAPTMYLYGATSCWSSGAPPAWQSDPQTEPLFLPTDPSRAVSLLPLLHILLLLALLFLLPILILLPLCPLLSLLPLQPLLPLLTLPFLLFHHAPLLPCGQVGDAGGRSKSAPDQNCSQWVECGYRDGEIFWINYFLSLTL